MKNSVSNLFRVITVLIGITLPISVEGESRVCLLPISLRAGLSINNFRHAVILVVGHL